MKKAFLFGVMVLVLSVAGSGRATIFSVTNETELHNALNTAASNGGDDIINIAAEIYNTSESTFSYTPAAGENYSLTIAGAGAGNTILDGGDSDQVMNIDTTGLGDDSKAHITVTALIFQNGNNSGFDGGGLYVRTNQANIAVEDCEFSKNTATGGYGGGAYAYSFSSGTVTYTNNIFDGNTAKLGGGAYGCSLSSGTVTYTNNTFSGNTAITYDGGGAYGYSSSSGTVTYTKNIFYRNTAYRNSGGAWAFSESGTVTYTNNIFDGNTAKLGGGAFATSNSGTVTFTNNTFSGNSAGSGGGGGFHIRLPENSATGNIYNNIVWNNTTTGSGDDIYVHDDYNWDSIGATVNLYNNDYGPEPNDFYIEVGGSTLSQGNNINTDPLLVDPATGDFHLQPGSPCIDKGTNAPELSDTDFEGDPRKVDGDNDGIATVDMGCDEFVSFTLIGPNGGEVIPSGSTCPIEWTAFPGAASFKLKYSMNKGKTWKLIASGITDTSYDWTVPIPKNNKKKCLVKVIGYNNSGAKVGADTSDGTFTIEVVRVTTPNGGEPVGCGQDPYYRQYYILWETYETKRPVAKVKLLYTKNNGRTWIKIATVDGNPGSYLWNVPLVSKTKSRCRVKVVLKDASGNTVGSDKSDDDFTIAIWCELRACAEYLGEVDVDNDRLIILVLEDEDLKHMRSGWIFWNPEGHECGGYCPVPTECWIIAFLKRNFDPTVPGDEKYFPSEGDPFHPDTPLHFTGEEGEQYLIDLGAFDDSHLFGAVL